MGRVLVIGDVHSTAEELEDCEKLIELVIDTANAQKVDHVLFMGDIYNSHNVMRVEVMAFWRRTFQTLNVAGIKTYVLVGNHDYGGEGLKIHSLMAHEEQVQVVNAPLSLFPNVMMVPYVSGNETFIQTCKEAGGTTLFCHQTFTGAKYENGMFAPDGVEPDEIPQEYVISGHIHLPNSFGKVTYVGAPRWRSLADADVERAIWIYSFDEQGRPRGRESFDTGKACRQIKCLTDSPEKPIDIKLDPNTDWRIDIKGPSDWITKRKAELAGPGVKTRTFCTDHRTPVLKESDGIDKAFQKFLENYTPKFGTANTRLQELARARIGGS